MLEMFIYDCGALQHLLIMHHSSKANLETKLPCSLIQRLLLTQPFDWQWQNCISNKNTTKREGETIACALTPRMLGKKSFLEEKQREMVFHAEVFNSFRRDKTSVTTVENTLVWFFFQPTRPVNVSEVSSHTRRYMSAGANEAWVNGSIPGLQRKCN